MNYDLLIRGGTVIDPSQQLHAVCDVGVRGDRIADIESRIDPATARHTIDARGLLVVPGLVDLHVHVYPHSPFGLEPDSLCSAGGVTTLLDAGTAGTYNFERFRREFIDRSRTRIRSLVHLSAIGLVSGNLGELRERRYADPDGVIEILERHADVAVGVKIRATNRLIGEGQQAWDNLNDAVRAARDSATWLMVHIGDCPMSLEELIDTLSPGDCITHCYRGSDTPILSDQGEVLEAVRIAADNGILFDVGHGAGSFEWEIAERALDQGFEPSTISTDLHTLNINGPVYDMPTTISKFLLLGMPLERAIELATIAPARKLNLDDEIGSLQPGRVADIAILEPRQGRYRFSDCCGETRIGETLLTAAVTIRNGEILPGGGSLLARQLAEDPEAS